MSNEKERMEIQKKILELDRQMGLELEKKSGRVGRLNPGDLKFPVGIWVTTAIVWAWVIFGGMFAPVADIHDQFLGIARIIGAIGVLLAIFKTVMWVLKNVKHKASSKTGYKLEETDSVRKLRIQKEELQARLEELKKKS